MKLSISKKLYLLFFIFVLIFYGTVADLLLRVRDMSGISGQIVAVNKRVAELSRDLRERLVDMEVNARKFTVVKSDRYFLAFESARLAYVADLEKILALEREAASTGKMDSSPGVPSPWADLARDHGDHVRAVAREDFGSQARLWLDQALLSRWMDQVNQARRENDEQIRHSLVRINDQGRQIVGNALVGFGISILVGALGLGFISRSMLRPLKALKRGLARVARDEPNPEIPLVAPDEFGEVTAAFNRMSRQLKADDEIRSDFIATLSHEIRTPLASIRESVNMIMEEVLGPVTEKQKKFLTLARDEIQRITGLLNRLLDISVLESASRRAPSPREPLEFSALADEALATLEGAARIKSLDLKKESEFPEFWVRGNGEELLQVLLNLLGNAVKFSNDPGRILIHLSRGSKGLLECRITDEGPGIPPEELNLIFKKYYRSGSVRRHMDGVGLGLHICRRILLDHGGEIHGDNNRTGGACFTFTLPLCEKEKSCQS
ncbi:MAG: ATP-binding protein [Desulfobacterales bacterium]|nr:ATP-binding protein [Desulfobacterales bacterium]